MTEQADQMDLKDSMKLLREVVEGHAGLDEGPRAILIVVIELLGGFVKHVDSIDQSLKSIAASQVIVAKEAEVSLEMLEEAKSGEPSAEQAEVDNWRDETL